MVHEAQQRLHVRRGDVPQDHDRMLAWIGLEEAAEVRTARRENDLVRGEAATVACQGHVHEILLVPQMTK